MTKARRLRTDVEEVRTPIKVTSTPSTRTTDGSAGGSTKGAQSVRLESGGTACGGIVYGGSEKKDSRERFTTSRGTCAHSAPYFVVTDTH